MYKLVYNQQTENVFKVWGIFSSAAKEVFQIQAVTVLYTRPSTTFIF